MTRRATLGALFVLGVGLIAAAAWMLHPAVCLLFVGVVLVAASVLGGARLASEEAQRHMQRKL